MMIFRLIKNALLVIAGISAVFISIYWNHDNIAILGASLVPIIGLAFLMAMFIDERGRSR